MTQSLAFVLFLVAGVILATAAALKASKDFVRDLRQQREFGSLFFDIYMLIYSIVGLIIFLIMLLHEI